MAGSLVAQGQRGITGNSGILPDRSSRLLRLPAVQARMINCCETASRMTVLERLFFVLSPFPVFDLIATAAQHYENKILKTLRYYHLRLQFVRRHVRRGDCSLLRGLRLLRSGRHTSGELHGGGFDHLDYRRTQLLGTGLSE